MYISYRYIQAIVNWSWPGFANRHTAQRYPGPVIPTRLPEYIVAAIIIILAPGPSVLFVIARAIGGRGPDHVSRLKRRRLRKEGLA